MRVLRVLFLKIQGWVGLDQSIYVPPYFQ